MSLGACSGANYQYKEKNSSDNRHEAKQEFIEVFVEHVR
jgi:hypothetical protein